MIEQEQMKEICETESAELFTPAGKAFLLALDPGLRRRVEKDFAMHVFTGQVDLKLGREVRESLIDGSFLLSLPLGSWKLTERAYAGNKTVHSLDRYEMHCPSGQALVSRFHTLVKRIPQLIDDSDSVIWSLGSGPGTDIFQMVGSSLPAFSQIRAVCVDIDEEAINRGREKAERLGLSDRVRFLEADFRRLDGNAPGDRPDIALLIGVICPMTPVQSTRLLRNLKQHFKSGTLLVVSSVIDRMRVEDPFSGYIADLVMNWHLIFKTEIQFRELVESAGYRWEGMFADELKGFHGMAMCRMP